MSDKPSEVNVPIEPFFRRLFFAAHAVVPAAAVLLLYANSSCYFEITWPLLVVVGVGLLPFILCLVGVYVGKIYGIELKPYPPFSGTKPLVHQDDRNRAPVPAVAPPGGAAPLARPAADENDDIGGMKPAELNVLRTIWHHQQAVIGEGKLWGFAVASASPDHGDFASGVISLMRRGLVQQDNNALVFLTQKGITFCQHHAERFANEGPYWKSFAPVSPEG